LVDVARVTCPPSVAANDQFVSPPLPEPEASAPHCRFPLESVSSTSVPLQPVTPTLVNEDWVTDEPRVVESKTRPSLIKRADPVGRFKFPPFRATPPENVEVEMFVTARLLMVEVPRKVGMFVAKILPPVIVSPLEEERPVVVTPPLKVDVPEPILMTPAKVEEPLTVSTVNTEDVAAFMTRKALVVLIAVWIVVEPYMERVFPGVVVPMPIYLVDGRITSAGLACSVVPPAIANLCALLKSVPIVQLFEPTPSKVIPAVPELPVCLTTNAELLLVPGRSILICPTLVVKPIYGIPFAKI